MPSADKFEWPQGNPLFEVQWRAVTESLSGNGVLNPGDFEVTADISNSLQINIAPGDMYYLGSTYTLSSEQIRTLDGGHPNYDRWDTVYFDTSSGDTDIRKGTAEQYPTPPDVTGDEHLLAIVYVPEGATDVPNENVLNWRASLLNESSDIRYPDDTGEFDVSNVQAALDELSEASQLTGYPIPQDDIVSPLKDISGYPLPQSDLDGPPSELSDYPLAIATDTDVDLGSEDLTANDGGVIVFDSDEGFVPRSQIDERRATTVVNAQLYTTSGEEHVLVDTASIGASSTITLDAEDTQEGKTIAIVDFTGTAEDNPVTINTANNQTIDGQNSKTIDVNYFGFVLTSDGSDWTTISTIFEGVGIESGGASVLAATRGLNFGQGLSVNDDGDRTVTIDADITSRVNYAMGTFSHTGGSSTTYRVEGVTTDQTKNLNVEVGVDADPSFSADYEWDYTWGYAWDDSDGEMDVVIEAAWDVDPGANNDVTLDFEVFELDGSKPPGVVIEDNGSQVVVPAKAIDFGSGLDVTDESDGTVRVDSTGGISMIKVATNDSSTNINQSVTFPWNVEEFSDSAFSFDSAANSITVQEDGTYEVHSNVAHNTAGTDRNAPVSQLYVNGNKQNAAGKSGYERHSSGHDEASTHFSWTGELTSGDTITVEMRQGGDGGTVNPQTDECNLFVKKLPRP